VARGRQGPPRALRRWPIEGEREGETTGQMAQSWGISQKNMLWPSLSRIYFTTAQNDLQLQNAQIWEKKALGKWFFSSALPYHKLGSLSKKENPLVKNSDMLFFKENI
jgi:hypothetical protein